jgi:hypothetical protein
MNLKLKVLVMVLCGLFLSGCIVSKAKLDESLAKCALLENDVRSKEQQLVKLDQAITALEATNKTLVANAEKTKQLCSDDLTKAKVTQEQLDSELLATKGQVIEKEKELLAEKADVVAKNKELLAYKDEMTRQLLEKDKETEDVIYRVREIQSRAEALLEKIKSI